MQYQAVDSFFSFWQMLRAADSVPREVFLRDLKLSYEDLELLTYLDSEKVVFDVERQERERNQAAAQRGAQRGGGSFGRRR